MILQVCTYKYPSLWYLTNIWNMYELTSLISRSVWPEPEVQKKVNQYLANSIKKYRLWKIHQQIQTVKTPSRNTDCETPSRNIDCENLKKHCQILQEGVSWIHMISFGMFGDNNIWDPSRKKKMLIKNNVFVPPPDKLLQLGYCWPANIQKSYWVSEVIVWWI